MPKPKKEQAPPPSPRVVEEMLSAAVLTEMVKGLEDTKTKLLVNVEELTKQLERQKRDQEDIYYYLNKKCDESYEVISSLENQLRSEQADREQTEKAYENQIEEIKFAAATEDHRLTKKVNDLENRLEMLNTFAASKDRIEGEMAQLVTELDKERTTFRESIDTIENKFLLERERIKKHYEKQHQDLKKQEAAKLDSKLSKKSKNISISNVMMKKELDDQSRHAERLLEINQSIADRDRNLKMEFELSTSMRTELEHSLTVAHRLMKDQNASIQHLDKKLRDTEEKAERRIDFARSEAQQYRSELENLRNKMALSTSGKKREAMLRFASNVIVDLKKEAMKKVGLGSSSGSAGLSGSSGSYGSSGSSDEFKEEGGTHSHSHPHGADMPPGFINNMSADSQEEIVVNFIKIVLEKYPKLALGKALTFEGGNKSQSQKESTGNNNILDTTSSGPGSSRKAKIQLDVSSLMDLVTGGTGQSSLLSQQTNFDEPDLDNPPPSLKSWDNKSQHTVGKRTKPQGIKRTVGTQTAENDEDKGTVMQAGTVNSKNVHSVISSIQINRQLKKILNTAAAAANGGSSDMSINSAPDVMGGNGNGSDEDDGAASIMSFSVHSESTSGNIFSPTVTKFSNDPRSVQSESKAYPPSKKEGRKGGGGGGGRHGGSRKIIIYQKDVGNDDGFFNNLKLDKDVTSSCQSGTRDSIDLDPPSSSLLLLLFFLLLFFLFFLWILV